MLSKNNAKEKATPKKELGYSYLIAAFVFLFNPCINVVDILPDFFGYIFLMKGLSKWADLCPNISDAMAGIGRLRWFMLIKMLSMVLVPLVDDTYVLIFVFSFGVIELIYALPAASRIFDGLEYFGTRFDSKVIFKGPEKLRKQKPLKPGQTPKAQKPARRAAGVKDMRLLTSIFFIVKTAFCIFPELCSLSSYEYSGVVTGGVQINPAHYKGFLIELNLVAGTLIGIIWLINIVSYINRISKDTAFLTRVLSDYNIEVGQDIGLAIRRRLRTCITLIIIGIAFLPNMWLDGVRFIPTFASAIFIVASMIMLRRISNVSKAAIVMPSLFGVISAASYALSLYFGAFFRIGDVYRDFETYDLFNATRILAILEYALMIAMIFVVCRELKRLVHTHLAPDPDITDKRIIKFSEDSQAQSSRAITAGFITFIIAALINLTYLVFRADVIADIWIAAFLATVVWIVYMAITMNRLYEQIEYKYM